MKFSRLQDQDQRFIHETPKVERRRRSMGLRTVAVLPTLMTLGNLLCGFSAVFLASRPADTVLPWHWTPLTFAAVCIFIGMFFDGLDGSVARLTDNTSELGEQLDSMADMVTFGVAPAFMAVQLIGIETPFLSTIHDQYFDRMTLVIAGIYVACAALRLARFNLELNQPTEADHATFKGLPTPGAAGTVASLVILHQHFLAHQQTGHWTLLASEIGMVGIMLLAGFAMVSKLRYVHVVNRYMRGSARFGVFVWVMICLLLLAVAPQMSLAGAFSFYALSAPTVYLCRRAWRRNRRPKVRL